MAYLPNKKILFLIVLVLLVFAGWFYFSNYKNNQTQYIAEKEKSPLAVVAEQDISLASSTSDWLLTLPGGDGSDKVEDVIAKTEKVLEDNSDNLTASYSKMFLTDYLALKQQKGEITAEDKQNLVNKLMGKMEPLAVVDRYSLSDLKILNDESKESIEKYAEGIKKVFIDTKSPRVSETDIFNDLLKNIKEGNINKIESDIKALNLYALWDEGLAKVILSLAVPENLAKSHLEVANGYNNLKTAMENMTTAKTDPVKAMLGQKLYDGQMKRAYDGLKNIQEVFNKYGITVFK